MFGPLKSEPELEMGLDVRIWIELVELELDEDEEDDDEDIEDWYVCLPVGLVGRMWAMFG